MAEFVYGLCALTSLACTWMLFRGYGRSGVKLLLWSSVCFAGFALNNILLFLDLVVLPRFDLSLIRTVPAIVGSLVLLYGLIWEGA
jgi:hypothetical protein